MKKSIAFLSIVYFPEFTGGAEVALREIAGGLCDEYQTTIVTLRGSSHERSEVVAGVLVVRVGFFASQKTRIGRISFLLQKLFFPVLALPTLVRLRIAGELDIVWSIMANYAGFAGLMAKGVIPRLKFVLTLQEGDPIEYIRSSVRFIYPFFRQIFRRADVVTAISQYLARWGVEEGVRRTPLLIPNGVWTQNFVPLESSSLREPLRATFGVSSTETFVVTTSRLVKKNGVDDLISAMAFLPATVVLGIAGTGELFDELKALAERLSIVGRVRFLGNLSHREIVSLLQSADVFVRPSRTEGMGNSFIEAMACGVPTIGTAVGGIPDFLIDGDTGYVCEVNNPKSIAENIVRVMELDVDGREKLVSCARKLVTDRYDWRLVIEKYRALVSDVCLN